MDRDRTEQDQCEDTLPRFGSDEEISSNNWLEKSQTCLLQAVMSDKKEENLQWTPHELHLGPGIKTSYITWSHLA